MKHWIQTHRRSAILVGLTLLLPAYLFLNVLGAALSARADYRDQIDSIEPRLARMQGLIEKEAEIQAGSNSVSNPCAASAVFTTLTFHSATNGSLACIRLHPPQDL